MILRRAVLFAFLVAGLRLAAAQPRYSEIVIARDAHPAVRSAAEILARSLHIPAEKIRVVPRVGNPRSGQIALLVVPTGRASADASTVASIKRDGYAIVFRRGAALVYGARPRSLLYAAGDLTLWKDKTSGEFVRNPDFATRTGQYDASRSVPDFVAELGVNAIIMRREGGVVTMEQTVPEVYANLAAATRERLKQDRAQAQRENDDFVRKCHDADVTVYAFLYGNDFRVWSSALYDAAVKAFPSAKGTPVPNSLEKNTLAPADPATWKLFRAYITELLQVTGADGLYATFWDRYGIYCKEDRCRAAGLDTFSTQLRECVKQYYEAVHGAGKKLVVRTWASGSPHWLRDEYVHAPGYGAFGGTEEQIWGDVIRDLPADIVLQTKVYYSDCEPDARFSPLIGHTAPHPQIVEYQVSGQFVGRFYFPAASVRHMADTMQRARELVGEGGGINIFPGGTMQTNYSVFDDILNSINVYAWRRLSWDVHAQPDDIWREWAASTYSPAAAPHMIKALALSEDVVNQTFTTLGLGSSTNSDFAGNIARRESLLRYTNRFYLPEYAALLAPTRENIQRVVDEKQTLVSELAEMDSELELAKAALTPAQAEEVATRFEWLKEFAIVNSKLDESLWRFRYLRYLDSQLTTDLDQLKAIVAAYDVVQQHAPRMFRHAPSQKFSCYSTTLGGLRTAPALGNPLPLMKELYTRSRELVTQSMAPDSLPADLSR